jgi:hypothetical protein
MKKISYIVEVEFEDHINDDNEINEVGNNILGAISTAVINEGITPEASETFTKSVSVTNVFTKQEITNKIY